MTISKREFLQVLAAASVAGLALGRHAQADAATAEQGLYDLPPFGNVSLLHMTDLPCPAAAHPFPRAQRQPGHRQHAGANCRTWWASSC